MEPSDPFQATRLAAADAQRRGDVRGAIVLVERALEATDASTSWRGLVRITLGWLCQADRQFSRALALADAALGELPDLAAGRSDAERLRGAALWSMGRETESNAALCEAFRLTERLENIQDRLLLKSYVLYDQADFEGCLTLMTASLPYSHTRFDAGVRRDRNCVAAQCAFWLGRGSETLAFARRAHEISAGADSATLQALGYWLSGDLERSLQWRRQAMENAECVENKQLLGGYS